MSHGLIILIMYACIVLGFPLCLYRVRTAEWRELRDYEREVKAYDRKFRATRTAFAKNPNTDAQETFKKNYEAINSKPVRLTHTEIVWNIGMYTCIVVFFWLMLPSLRWQDYHQSTSVLALGLGAVLGLVIVKWTATANKQVQ